MSTEDRLDPELVAPIGAWRNAMKGGIDLRDIPGTRRLMEELIAQLPKPEPVEGVRIEDRHAPGPEGGSDVFVRIYRPTGAPGPLPGLLWIHGGGYVLGKVERDDLMAANLCKTVGCVVASVEYRLAPEHPFPVPLEDCYAALKWFAGSSAEFGVDAARIAVGGASAGGGLAAGLALLTRDRAEVRVAAQLLIYPMIDDRNIAPASAERADTHVWSRENNRAGWRAYLGREPGGVDVPIYAAASRAADLSRLPPAYIAIGDLDLFLEENVDYALRLQRAGIPAELHVYPGACHGFNGMAPNAAISKRFDADRDAALRRMLRG